MNLSETKSKVLSGLKERKANVSISFGDQKDEAFKQYKYGEITLAQFVGAVSEDSPYTIVETFNGNFLVIDKKTKLPPQSFLNPNSLKNILSEEMKPKIISTYPELRDFIEKTYKEINTAGCTGCARNSKIHAVIQEIMFLDNSNRDFSAIKEVFGERFIEALKSYPKQQRPVVKDNRRNVPNKPGVENQEPSKPSSSDSSASSNKSLVPPFDADQLRHTNQESVKEAEAVFEAIGSTAAGENGPRPSCIECCMKHIGTAIVLMEEALNGYPSHRWIAAGELNEAANETLRDFPDVAREIRETRHLVVKDIGKCPDLMVLLNKLDKKFFYN